MNDTSLREVEKKTYMSYHQDGLLDIFVGTYIVLFGLGILLLMIAEFSTWFIIPAIFPALMVPVWVSAKKKVTMPRIGYVKIGSKGSNKLMAVFLGMMVAGLGMFMVFSFASDQAWAVVIRDLIINNAMIIIGVGALGMCSLFAYTTGLTRLYAYGILSFAVFIIGYFVSVPFAYLPLAIGIVIMVSGFVLLLRFIKKYPLVKGGIKSDK